MHSWHPSLFLAFAFVAASCVSNPTPHPGNEGGNTGGGSTLPRGSGGGSATVGDPGTGGGGEGAAQGDGTDMGGGAGDDPAAATDGAAEADAMAGGGADAGTTPWPAADVSEGGSDVAEGDDAGPSAIDDGAEDADGDADPDGDGGSGAADTDDVPGEADGPLFTLSSPEVTAQSEDGVWSPGGALSVTVTLTNDSGEDYMAYPGVRLESDADWAVVEVEDFTFFGLFADTSSQAFFTVLATEDASVGDEVVLTVTVFALNCETSGLGECPYALPLDITLQLGD